MTPAMWSRLSLLVVVTATIGCDRVTKHAATLMLAGTAERSYLADTVRLTYAENTGGFLGLGAGWPPLMMGVAIFLIAEYRAWRQAAEPPAPVEPR